MGFNGQQKLAVLLVRRGVVRHTQHVLLARAVNIGIEQAYRQPLSRKRCGQIRRDGGLANTALSRGNSNHMAGRWHRSFPYET